MKLYALRKKIQERKDLTSSRISRQAYAFDLTDLDFLIADTEFRLAQLEKIHFENLSFGHIDIDCWCYKIMDELVLILGKKEKDS